MERADSADGRREVDARSREERGRCMGRREREGRRKLQKREGEKMMVR